MKVTVDEIVKWLRNGDFYDDHLADRIEAHGIEQPSIDALIAEIDGIDRWFYDDGSGPYMCNKKDGGDYFFISDIDAIIDKYRGQK